MLTCHAKRPRCTQCVLHTLFSALSSALCLPWQTLSLKTVKKTNLVVGNKISLFRLSWKTKFVVKDKVCLPDDKVCRGRQSLSLATQLVVLDGPKYRQQTLFECHLSVRRIHVIAHIGTQCPERKNHFPAAMRDVCLKVRSFYF